MPVQDAEPVPQGLQLLMRAGDMLGRIRDIRRARWRTGVRRAGIRVRFFHVEPPQSVPFYAAKARLGWQ